MAGFFRWLSRIIRLLLALAVLGAGWIAGDRYGMPDWLREEINSVLGDTAAGSSEALRISEDYLRARLEEARDFDFNFELPEDISAEDLRVGTQADRANTPAGTAAGEAKTPAKGQKSGSTPQPPLETASPAPRQSAAQAAAKICPGMTVSNAPRTDGAGHIQGIPARIKVKGVALRTIPILEGCLSSGFGPRRGRAHKGVDFHHPSGSDVLAAASGQIVEAQYRDDFGNYIVIDHGKGVYTRYAHLARFGPGIREGAAVMDGQRLGQMGNTASYRIPIHLHYEVLMGDYNTQAGTFGLTPIDPLTGRA